MKFKAEEVKTQEELALIAEGKIVPEAVLAKRTRVLIPIDDAAKASEACRPAIDAGLYTPKKGEEPEVMRKKIKERELENWKKGKGLPT